MHSLDQLSAQDIAKRLTRTGELTHDIPAIQPASGYKQAGVLVPFIRKEDSWHLLYIRRAELERDMHSGQVAFAGGKYEAHDKDLQDTALREAHEEIGVAPDDVMVLGQLDYHHSISHYRITPVVGQIPWPYPLKLQASEVGRAFSVPLAWLTDPANHEIRYQELPQHNKPTAIVYFNEYDGELLWGATARMTLSLINLLLKRD